MAQILVQAISATAQEHYYSCHKQASNWTAKICPVLNRWELGNTTTARNKKRRRRKARGWGNKWEMAAMATVWGKRWTAYKGFQLIIRQTLIVCVCPAVYLFLNLYPLTFLLLLLLTIAAPLKVWKLSFCPSSFRIKRLQEWRQQPATGVRGPHKERGEDKSSLIQMLLASLPLSRWLTSVCMYVWNDSWTLRVRC